MLGTHSRVGEYSPVQRISGCTPVIAKIQEYLVDPEETERSTMLEKIHNLVKVPFLLSKRGCCEGKCKSKGRDRFNFNKGIRDHITALKTNNIISSFLLKVFRF